MIRVVHLNLEIFDTMGPYSSEPEVLLTHVMTVVGDFKDETQSFTISTYYENPIYFQNSITFNY